MKFTPNGTPYDICPVCGQMILPKAYGGKAHINGHKETEANKYFRQGKTILQVNQQLMMLGITLFPNIPPKMQNVSKDTTLLFKGHPCRITGIGEYDTLRLEIDNNPRPIYYHIWDGAFLANLKHPKS